MTKFRESCRKAGNLIARTHTAISGKAGRLAAVAVGGTSAVVAGSASAQYTPTTPAVQDLFNWTDLGVSFLTVAAAALTVVVGIGPTIAVALGLYRRFRGQAA